MLTISGYGSFKRLAEVYNFSFLFKNQRIGNGKNNIQFWEGLNLPGFMTLYGTEEQCFNALFQWRSPTGSMCQSLWFSKKLLAQYSLAATLSSAPPSSFNCFTSAGLSFLRIGVLYSYD